MGTGEDPTMPFEFFVDTKDDNIFVCEVNDEGSPIGDKDGVNAFKILPDKSFVRLAPGTFSKWASRAHTISEREAFRLAGRR